MVALARRLAGKLPGKTPQARTRIGVGLLCIGAVLLIVAFIPLNFMHRLAGRVDVPGVVVDGISAESISSEDGVSAADGESGYWKVDYEIDGSPHTGILPGVYSRGEQVLIAAPGDGTVYQLLSEADSAGIKVLSWFFALGALGALGIGAAGATSGLRMSSRQAQDLATARMAAHTGIPVAVLQERMKSKRELRSRPDPQSQRPVEAQWQRTTIPDERRAPGSDTSHFHRPYDLD